MKYRQTRGNNLKKLLLALLACVLSAPAFAQKPTRSGIPDHRALERHLPGKAGLLNLKSTAALVIDLAENRVLYAKNVDTVVPVASITKLMTAIVVLDSGAALDEWIAISEADIDDLKRTRSRLRIGTNLTREALLQLALMASENRAAAALSRAHPGGARAFVTAMNHKAIELGMLRTRFVDGTGLSSDNVSTAQDLARLVAAAHGYPRIREFTTAARYTVELSGGKFLQYNNSNGLVKNANWTIGLSKTGYISEAGRCLVMQTRIASLPVVIVLLDSWGRNTRMGDANRIKKWMESMFSRRPAS